MSDLSRIANELRLLAEQVRVLPDGDGCTHSVEDAGLHKAEDIAGHWHQRFLTLSNARSHDQEMSAPLRKVLRIKAEAAKLILDEIRAERKRLAQSAASGGGDFTTGSASS